MTQDEAKTVAKAVVAELDKPGRPRTAPAPVAEPRNGTVLRWVAGIGATLMAGGITFLIASVLSTSSGLAVAEVKIDAAHDQLKALVPEVREINRKLDQLIGRDSVRPPPAGGRR